MIAGNFLPGYSDIKYKKRENKEKNRNPPLAPGLAASALGFCSSLTDVQSKIGNTIDIYRSWP